MRNTRRKPGQQNPLVLGGAATSPAKVIPRAPIVKLALQLVNRGIHPQRIAFRVGEMYPAGRVTQSDSTYVPVLGMYAACQ